jgi:hypothetical protein
MRFTSDTDKKMFLLEIGRTDLIEGPVGNFSPDQEMINEFVKRRREIIPGLKNFRRSQKTKDQWRKDRYGMLKGIKRFHKSTTGKKFHRALGRFISSRIYNKTDSLLHDRGAERKAAANESVSLNEVIDVLQGLSSLKTHAFVEFEFYHPLTEEIEYRMFMEELLPFLERVEKRLWQGSTSFCEEDEEFLCRIVSEKAICNSISLDEKLDFEIVEKLFEKSGKELNEKSYTKEQPDYMRILLENLKGKITAYHNSDPQS